MAKSMLERLRGGLIVSCQAPDESPLHDPRFMAGFARAAEVGGAVALRVNGAPDVRAVRKAVGLPIIGINKQRDKRWPVFITPSWSSAYQVVRAGADIVALDATHRLRHGWVSPELLITRIKAELGVPVMADIDSLAEGLAAAKAGADIVATTLAGYTDARKPTSGPDLRLLRALAGRLDVPIICEGRIRNPTDVAAAFAAGAFAVVVGTAITNPVALTEAFAAAAPAGRKLTRRKHA